MLLRYSWEGFQAQVYLQRIMAHLTLLKITCVINTFTAMLYYVT